MADPLHLLMPLQWRGVEYPVTSRNVTFAHESVQHKLQRRNQDLVEQTGAHNFVFTYTIPMREGIFKGPYKNLFTQGLARLLKDFRNREPGQLLDPVYGEFRCVPSSYTDDTDVMKTDGTDIRVEFTYAPEDGDTDVVNPFSLMELVDDGRNLEVAVQQLAALAETDDELAAIQEFEQFEGEEGGTDVLSAINGAGQQILGQSDRIAAYLDDVAFRAEKIEDTADRLENPDGWQLKRSARRVRDTATRLKRRTDDPAARTKIVTMRFARSMTSLAAETGHTVAELLRLNPQLTRSPLIPAGAQVLIPQRARGN